MFRGVWISRAAKIVVTALVATLFSFVSPSAQAEFFRLSNTGLNSDGLYLHFDNSDSGEVIATADGYASPSQTTSPGYLYVSNNSGVSFVEKTSVGKQGWRSVEVSNDGKVIAAVTSSSVYVSQNSGADFALAYTLPIAEIQIGDVLQEGSLSGDGKVIYLVVYNKIIRLTYDSNGRRWLRTLNSVLPDYQTTQNVTTNYTGNIAYVAARSLYKVTGNTRTEILTATNFINNYTYLWKDIVTSNSGDEVIALPDWDNSAGKFYKSENGGTSFSTITTINGSSFDQIESIDLSGDGTAIFFSTNSSQGGDLYSQHGKNSDWEDQYGYWYRTGFERLSTNLNGSLLLAGRLGFPIQIALGAPTKIELAVINGSFDQVMLEWTTYNYRTSTYHKITDIQLQYATSSSGPWTTYNDGPDTGGVGRIYVRGLASPNTYYFRARAQNYFGYSSWSTVRSFVLYGRPSIPPAPVQVSTTDKSVLLFEIGVPTNFGGETQLSNQSFIYSLDSGANWISSRWSPYPVAFSYANSNTPGIATHARITGLPSGTPILVQTIAANSQANSYSPTATFYVYTKPSAVTNFQVNTVFTNSTLSWAAPSDLGGGTISYYKYSYKRAADSSWTSETTTSTTASISGLQGGTLYDYKAQAITTQGVESLEAFVFNDQAINPPTKLSVTRNVSGARSSESFTVQPKVSLLDVNNNVVTSESRAEVVASVSGGATLIGRDTATATSGVATFTNLGLKGRAGATYTITYRSSNLVIATETVTLQAGTTAGLRFERNAVGGAHSVAFETQTVLAAIDIDGNLVTSDDTTTVTVSASEGFLSDGNSGSPSATAVDGVITFANVRLLGEAGRRPVLTYSSAGLNSLQETLTITTGLASTFTRIIRAADAYIGGKFGTQPTYQVTDSAGNIVTTGSYLITVTPSTGSIVGRNSVETVNGVATFTDLGIKGVGAGQLVMLSVSSAGFTTYTGDSIITRKGYPILSWSDYYIPRGTSAFTIPSPDSSTAGTFSYSSSNSSVISISGSTVTVGNSGTATITATFTPSNTTDFYTGETITSVFTVLPSGGTLIVSAPNGVAQKGISNTLTATASDNGAVTFFVNGKRIPGCIGVRTQSSSATCSWKPSLQGSVTLSALLVPNNDLIETVRSAPVNVPVVRRTGRR